MHNKLAFSILFALLLIYIKCPILLAENNYVKISYNKEKGIVNKMVLGNNFIGEKVCCEWAMICLGHNILKLFRSGKWAFV